MPFISVTRLHLRSWRFFPSFIAYTLASTRQVKRAEGFLGGYLGTDDERGAWTVTVWRDQESMRRFRNSGAHLRAMPKLLNWCDEASIAHWTDEHAAAPMPQPAFEGMSRVGRVSKVRHPSRTQQAGRLVGSGPPQVGLRLMPLAARAGD